MKHQKGEELSLSLVVLVNWNVNNVKLIVKYLKLYPLTSHDFYLIR